MDVSIIIPHYNTPQLLKRLLNSIPMLDGIEVIVIDDNSNVDVELYKTLYKSHPHVTFLANETGERSPGTCRNIGLRYAKGRWLLFADADDFFVEGFYGIIKKHLSADADIIFFVPASIDAVTGKEATRHIYYKNLVYNYMRNNNRLAELRLRYEYTAPWSKLVRSECVQKNEIVFGNTLICEDAVFTIKLGSCAQKIIASDKVIYYVTARTGSLSTIVTREKEKVRADLFVEHYHFLMRHLSQEDFKLLDLNGLPFIISAIMYKHGIKTVCQVFMSLKKNKIRIIGRRWFQISHWRWKIKEFRSNKKYYL